MFSRAILTSITISAILFSSGCGRFGKNPEREKVLKYSTEVQQCSSRFKSDLSLYIKGEISPGQWESSCNCILDALTMFQNNVRPAKGESYSRQDIKTFLTQFLLKDVSVSDDLIRNFFELKMALFGGDSEYLTKADLARVYFVLSKLKEQSILILPHLARRTKEPKSDELLELASKLEDAGDVIAHALNPGAVLFSKAQIGYLLTEAEKISKTQISQEYLEFGGQIKTLLIGGSQDYIEPIAWPRLIQLLGRASGMILAGSLAYDKTWIGDPDNREFLWQLLLRGKQILGAAIDRHGGSISFNLLDQVIDSIPNQFTSIDRTEIKKVLRPLSARFIHPAKPETFDHAALNRIFEIVKEWHENQYHLEKIFEEEALDKSGVSVEKFSSAALTHGEELEGECRESVKRLVFVAKRYRPLFLEGDTQVSFSAAQRLTFRHLSFMHAFRLMSEIFIASYGVPFAKENSKALGFRIPFEEFETFIKDFEGFLFALKFLDPQVANIPKRHFINMNLFTWVGNGDNYIDVDEVTYYLPLLVSAKMLSKRIRAVIAPTCSTLDMDRLDWFWMEPKCFRSELRAAYVDLWDHFPELVRTFGNLDTDSQSKMLWALEKGSRRFGYTELPYGSYDTDATAMIVNYVESMFSRFDHDGNEVLDLDEIVKAFPVFKMKLATFGNIDPSEEGKLLAAFTYTVNYGSPPNPKEWKSLLHFIGWWARKPFWKISARRDVIFRVLSALNIPEALPQGVTASQMNALTDPQLNDASSWSPFLYYAPKR